MKYLNWIITTPAKGLGSGSGREMAKLVICNDGTTLSVQASESHYCTPRNNQGPWSLVEVGFPSATPQDEWIQYFDGEWHRNRWHRFWSVYWGRIIFAIKQYKSWGKYYDSWQGQVEAVIRNLKCSIRMARTPIGCDGVYAWIPIYLVKNYINLHLGENTEACLAQYETLPPGLE